MVLVWCCTESFQALKLVVHKLADVLYTCIFMCACMCRLVHVCLCVWKCMYFFFSGVRPSLCFLHKKSVFTNNCVKKKEKKVCVCVRVRA